MTIQNLKIFFGWSLDTANVDAFLLITKLCNIYSVAFANGLNESISDWVMICLQIYGKIMHLEHNTACIKLLVLLVAKAFIAPWH